MTAWSQIREGVNPTITGSCSQLGGIENHLEPRGYCTVKTLTGREMSNHDSLEPDQGRPELHDHSYILAATLILIS
jgi:hypothetical protein